VSFAKQSANTSIWETSGPMKNHLWIACFSVLLILEESGILAFAEADAPKFSAGTAKVDITPSAELAVNLVGQRLGPREPLYARAIVLKDQNISLAIVGTWHAGLEIAIGPFEFDECKCLEVRKDREPCPHEGASLG